MADFGFQDCSFGDLSGTYILPLSVLNLQHEGTFREG